MITKKKLLEENKMLIEELNKQRKEIHYLNERLNKPTNEDNNLNLQYMLLLSKYKKLLNSCLSKETENIVYNGRIYKIQRIDYHKEADSVDSIDIRALEVPKEKGLIDNLTEPFKEVAKELNKIFFGNEGGN